MLTPWNTRSNVMMDPFTRDPFFKELLSGIEAPFQTGSLLRGTNVGVCVDVLERDTEYLLIADLAGIPKENIDVHIEANGFLNIMANKVESRNLPSEFYICQERNCGRIQKRVKLPVNADVDRVVAVNRDGCLILTIPKLAVGAGGIKKLAIL
jgi:HSP20 family protein